ncbi:MFS transporter [Streptomyces sp. 769]|uniref:MFS transporter n=1 Tax=Streptomyces sp. 769 TaxID=1262452 RepID=UPI000ABFD75D|nr:MFS transporter [Streptomyces sp. 769]
MGQFMVVLDTSIVTVALPAMGVDLGFSGTGLQWVINAYSLTFAGFMLFGGRLADLLGRRAVYLLGISLFTLASLVGGFSASPTMLIASRAIQGIGAAIVAPTTMTLLTTTFSEGPARARALGLWSAVGAGGGAAGSIFGGVLTQFVTWRWILWINVPVGVALVVLALAGLRENGPVRPQHRRVDAAGAVSVTLGVSALSLAVVNVKEYGWSSASFLLPLTAAVVLLAAFGFVERRLGNDALFPLRVIKGRAMAFGSVLAFLMGAAFFSMWYFLSLYLQNVLHYSPLQTGLAFIPDAVAIVVSARLVSRYIAVYGTRLPIAAGSALAALGFAIQAQLGADALYFPGVFVAGLLMCVGVGMVFTPISTTVSSSVGHDKAGMASAMVNFSRQMGGSLGLPALAVLSLQLSGAWGGGSERQYSIAFLVSAVLVLAGLPLTFLLPKRK